MLADRRAFLTGIAAGWECVSGEPSSVDPCGVESSVQVATLEGQALLQQMRWLHPPVVASRNSTGRLEVLTRSRTDFWRRTRYDYIADNGHMFYRRITGNFLLESRVSGEYRTLYDQAGLMLRLDAHTWLKCGLVLNHGVGYATTVITREFSDWSGIAGLSATTPMWWRIARRGQSIEVLYSIDGQSYTSARVGYLPLGPTVGAGIMCASPEGSGLRCCFDHLRLAALRA
jgi:uncharacterized protein